MDVFIRLPEPMISLKLRSKYLFLIRAQANRRVNASPQRHGKPNRGVIRLMTTHIGYSESAIHIHSIRMSHLIVGALVLL